MKDRQVEPASSQPRIPFLSAVLHWVAMTVLVYLRASFGFAYLSPKSVFFAFSWAFVLFTIYAWNEPEEWLLVRGVCIFGTGAVVLYWLHLLRAFTSELYRKGKHDHYSGKSHLSAILAKTPLPSGAHFEMNLHLWAEPAAVILIGLICRFVFGEHYLSAWLFFAAACLWLKEAMNYWFHLRQRKRQQDMFADTGETVDLENSGSAPPERPKATRKERVKRTRTTVSDTAEHRHAEILRLLPPYSLEQAEDNYRKLIKIDHPDSSSASPESASRSIELNEAIEYFRERLQG